MARGPTTCTTCKEELQSQRTHQRTRVVTLQGEATLKLTTWACKDHPGVTWQAPYHQILRLLPHRQISLDVMVAVGILRWGLDLQRIEIRQVLERHGLFLSTGQISHLSDEFFVRYRMWFESSRPNWAPKLRRGLILLIDGTQDGGGPVTYRAIAYKQRVTVHAASITSENGPDLAKFLETVKQEVGTPKLIVRDHSTAAKNASTQVFPGVPQRGCHWHFLKNAGEALLEDAYHALRKAILDTNMLVRLDELRKKLVKAAALAKEPRRRALRVWARLLLEDVLGARATTGGFPLRLAYHEVMLRVQEARKRLKDVVKASQAWNVHEPLLLEVKQLLDVLGENTRVRSLFISVTRRWGWFSRLRSCLRLEGATSGRPGEGAGEQVDADSVARFVYQVRREAEQAHAVDAAAWKRVISRFENLREDLFPVVRLRNPPRTTTLIEVAHREDRRACRRRTGTIATRAVMERVGEHLALWSNVGKPWFSKHALQGVDLVAAFSVQDPAVVEAGVVGLKAKRWRERLPVVAGNRGGLLDEFLGLALGGGSEEALMAWADRVEGVGA